MGHPLDPSNPLDMGIFPQVPRDQWPQPRPVLPTPTLREMQMQAAHRGRGPGDWQAGGAVGYQGGGRTMNPRAGGAARSRAYKDWMAFNNPLAPTGPGGTGQLQWPVRHPPPGDWQEGGVVDYERNFAPPWERDVDPREILMAERDRLQQLLQQTTDEAMAQEIQMQIREITKELDMDMRMAGGGLASLRGGGRTMNPRAAGAAALRRRFPQPMQRLMPGQPGVSADDPRLQWQVGGPGGG